MENKLSNQIETTQYLLMQLASNNVALPQPIEESTEHRADEENVTKSDEKSSSQLYYYSQEEKIHHNESSIFSSGKINLSEPDVVNRNVYAELDEEELEVAHESSSDLNTKKKPFEYKDRPLLRLSGDEDTEKNSPHRQPEGEIFKTALDEPQKSHEASYNYMPDSPTESAGSKQDTNNSQVLSEGQVLCEDG